MEKLYRTIDFIKDKKITAGEKNVLHICDIEEDGDKDDEDSIYLVSLYFIKDGHVEGEKLFEI